MNIRAISEQLVGARLRAEAMATFPAQIPGTLAEAYDIQDSAIALWPDRIAGWKVGRIDPAIALRLGEDRLVGPVFAQDIRAAASGGLVDFPVFEGGFAAVEAEFVFRLASGAQAGKVAWTTEEAAQLVAALHVGIETAGSPLALINELGPTVVVSDFGNNAGLLLGPEIAGWRDQALASLTCETFIDGRSVGRGGALSLAGGPLAALAFALGRCAQRGRPLAAGDLVSTGATTGIHAIRQGERAQVRFDGIAELWCHAVPAAARPGAPSFS